MLRCGVVTLLPEMFNALNYGVTGRAIKNGLIAVDYFNPRDFNQQVDDTPYGGGGGMVMLYQPLKQALDKARKALPNAQTIYLSPQGQTVQQEHFNKLATQHDPVIFIAGRYEGVDQRFIDNEVDLEWSLGDFVLSGGEIAAMAFIDAIARLIPGALGHPGSAVNDSFMTGLLDYPQYTKPQILSNNLAVPEVLLSGDHNKISQWRRQQALGATWLKRPDLLQKFSLSTEDKKMLKEFQSEHKHSDNN